MKIDPDIIWAKIQTCWDVMDAVSAPGSTSSFPTLHNEPLDESLDGDSLIPSLGSVPLGSAGIVTDSQNPAGHEMITPAAFSAPLPSLPSTPGAVSKDISALPVLLPSGIATAAGRSARQSGSVQPGSSTEPWCHKRTSLTSCKLSSLPTNK